MDLSTRNLTSIRSFTHLTGSAPTILEPKRAHDAITAERRFTILSSRSRTNAYARSPSMAISRPYEPQIERVLVADVGSSWKRRRSRLLKSASSRVIWRVFSSVVRL
jgi:hypothetical protein